MMPPSAMPINSRAPSNQANPDAKPDNTDAIENTMVAVTSISLRRPNRSTRLPMPSPAIAQLKENAEAILPI